MRALRGRLLDVRHQASIQPPGPVHAHRQRLTGERARHAGSEPALRWHAERRVSPNLQKYEISCAQGISFELCCTVARSQKAAGIEIDSKTSARGVNHVEGSLVFIYSGLFVEPGDGYSLIYGFKINHITHIPLFLFFSSHAVWEHVKNDSPSQAELEFSLLSTNVDGKLDVIFISLTL